jgi:hypothetical protein
MIEVIVATIARIRPRTQAAVGGQSSRGIDNSAARRTHMPLTWRPICLC